MKQVLAMVALICTSSIAVLCQTDPLADLRTEARREIASAARLETKTDTVSGTGEAKNSQVPRTTVTLFSGETRYKLEYACATDASGRRLEMGQTLSELGMSEPSPANWYQGGFLDVTLEGQGLAALPAKVEPTNLPEGSAGVRIAWSHPKGQVAVCFRTFSFDPFLYVTMELPAATTRQISLLCYPNSFQLPRDRWITTPERDIQHKNDLRESVGQHERDWILYSDRAAGLVAAPTTGPCALVTLPDQVDSITVEMGKPERPDWPAVQNYGVLTTIAPRPGVQRLAFALMDFLPMTWMQAKSKLLDETPQVQERLRRMLTDTAAQ